MRQSWWDQEFIWEINYPERLELLRATVRGLSKIFAGPPASSVLRSEPVNAIVPSDRANKIGIVLDYLKGADSIVGLCRRNGIA